MKNCVCIGRFAGADITDEENLVIIGDDIRSVPEGARMVIGKYVAGVRCNLYDILYEKSPELIEDGVFIMYGPKRDRKHNCSCVFPTQSLLGICCECHKPK